MLLLLRDGGVDLVQFVLVARRFEVHERDSSDDRLMIVLHGLLPIPQAWYSRIKELLVSILYL
jgi:hypothetical protein